MASPGFLSHDGRLLLERISRLAGVPTSGMGTYWVPSGFRIADAKTGKPFATVQSREEPATPIAFSPDSRLLIGLPRGHDPKPQPIVVYEVRSGKPRLKVSDIEPGHHPAVVSPTGRWLAIGTPKGDIDLVDLGCGKVVHTLRPDTPSRRLLFSPDGRRLASGHEGGTIFLWDVQRWPTRPMDSKPLDNAEQTQLWADLASLDPAKAYAAMMRLDGRPADAVPWLQENITAKVAPAKIEKMVGDLDSEEFAARDASVDALSALGETARPFLEHALFRPRSVEHRRRVEALLDKLGAPFTSPASLRMFRAVEVLERLGTPEAIALLRRIAQPGDAAIGDEAKRSLKRLDAQR
jgi:hypothetical protein